MMKFTEIYIIGFSSKTMEAPQLVTSYDIAIKILRNILSARQCKIQIIKSE